MPIQRTKSQLALANLKGRLQESEKRRQKELEDIRDLTKAVLRIQETEEWLPQIQTLVDAEDTSASVSCRAKSGLEALQLLKEGNARFLENWVEVSKQHQDAIKKGGVMTHPLDLHIGQRPHTVLITCSDSRVPPEMVFDQGLGDLFVIRLAGNAVDTLARASLIYALVHLQAPLVCVMGHESCGAVQAALARDEDLKNEPSDIKALVANIRGGLKTVIENSTHEERVTCGVVCNVHHTVEALKADTDIAQIAEARGVVMVGAYYAFNGAVTFFDKQTLDEGVTHLRHLRKDKSTCSTTTPRPEHPTTTTTTAWSNMAPISSTPVTMNGNGHHHYETTPIKKQPSLTTTTQTPPTAVAEAVVSSKGKKPPVNVYTRAAVAVYTMAFMTLILAAVGM